jgi:hypothetical protein
MHAAHAKTCMPPPKAILPSPRFAARTTLRGHHLPKTGPPTQTLSPTPRSHALRRDNRHTACCSMLLPPAPPAHLHDHGMCTLQPLLPPSNPAALCAAALPTTTTPRPVAVGPPQDRVRTVQTNPLAHASLKALCAYRQCGMPVMLHQHSCKRSHAIHTPQGHRRLPRQVPNARQATCLRACRLPSCLQHAQKCHGWDGCQSRGPRRPLEQKGLAAGPAHAAAAGGCLPSSGPHYPHTAAGDTNRTGSHASSSGCSSCWRLESTHHACCGCWYQGLVQMRKPHRRCCSSGGLPTGVVLCWGLVSRITPCRVYCTASTAAGSQSLMPQLWS